MYMPAHFEETDQRKVRDLMNARPLAALVAHTPGGLVANHVPVLLRDDEQLIGHVALANELHTVLDAGQEVLLIFRGEDSYVSPNWYPSKAQHHRHVPTWNYQVAHVHGRISFQHDEQSKRAAVALLTRHHESMTNGQHAWKMSDAPADFMAEMLAGIVAFRIAVDRIVAKSKLSQNREPGDRAGVVDSLENSGKAELARSMRGLASPSNRLQQ
ncbi:MAG: FMN-binding negative transcriptional regulator [Pseudomonadota bacterium]